jgi:hypothetical protein
MQSMTQPIDQYRNAGLDIVRSSAMQSAAMSSAPSACKSTTMRSGWKK